MNLRDQLNLERLWRRGPVVSVLRFEGVIMPRQRRGGLSLASHAGAIEKAFRASGLVAVAIVSTRPADRRFNRPCSTAESGSSPKKARAGNRFRRRCGGLGRLLAGARRRRN